MTVPKAGKYKINCKQTMIWLYDAEGKLISNFNENDTIYLLKIILYMLNFFLLVLQKKLN